MVSDDSLQGDNYFACLGVVDDPPTVLVSGKLASSGGVSYAMYRHAAREDAEVPYMATIEGRYQDPDPRVYRTGEGFFVSYADYATGSWAHTGPYRTSKTRVLFPDAAEVVSPGGFIYTLIIAYKQNEVKVDSVKVGYDIGLDYETEYLSRPPGQVPSDIFDIKLDESGNPHIAYILQPGRHPLEVSDEQHVRVAHWTGSEWENEDVAVVESKVHWIEYELGSEGRRALMYCNEAENNSSEIHLYCDSGDIPGGGALFKVDQFDSGYQTREMSGGLIYVNSTDDPAGSRDLLVITYAEDNNGAQARYRILKNENLGDAEQLFVPNLPWINRISLCRSKDDMKAAAGICNETGGEFSYHIGMYSATTDTWDFSAITPWVPPSQPGWFDSSELHDMLLQPVSGGLFVIGTSVQNNINTYLALWNGTTWQTDPYAILPLSEQPQLAFGIFPDNSICALARFGKNCPRLLLGRLSQGEPWDEAIICDREESMHCGSLVTDDAGGAHIAAFDQGTLELVYYYRDPDGQVTGSVVETGAGLDSASGFTSICAYAGDRLYVFYSDIAAKRLMYSVNQNGIWISEHKQAVQDSDYVAYLITDAGYLEEADLLYVAYTDYDSFSRIMAFADPDLDNWSEIELASKYSELSFTADNETNVGVLGIEYSLAGRIGQLVFCQGDPRSGMSEWETVQVDISGVHYQQDLAFNSFDNTWYALTNNSELPIVWIFQRTGPDAWHGPYLVYTGDEGSHVENAHLCFSSTDGSARAIIHEQTAAGMAYLKILSAPAGSTEFTHLANVAEFDTSVTEPNNWLVVESDNEGLPLIGSFHRPVGEQAWDLEIFEPAAPDDWQSVGIWQDRISRISWLHGAADSNGKLSLVSVESDENSPNWMKTMVHHPW